MANNRMYLKCKLCGSMFYISKYYPSTGWYINASEGLKGFIEFLDKHSPSSRRDPDGNFSVEHPHVFHGDPSPAQINEGDTFTLEYGQ